MKCPDGACDAAVMMRATSTYDLVHAGDVDALTSHHVATQVLITCADGHILGGGDSRSEALRDLLVRYPNP